MKKPSDIAKSILDAKKQYEELNQPREFYFVARDGMIAPDKVKLTFNHRSEYWAKDSGWVPDEELLFVELNDAIDYSVDKCRKQIERIQQHIDVLDKMRNK